MLGAILGDIVGSPYEFDHNNIKTTQFPLFGPQSEFTDDTVMTLAVAEGLMDSWGKRRRYATRCVNLAVCTQRRAMASDLVFG